MPVLMDNRYSYKGGRIFWEGEGTYYHGANVFRHPETVGDQDFNFWKKVSSPGVAEALVMVSARMAYVKFTDLVLKE